jgi:hypothetical protein
MSSPSRISLEAPFLHFSNATDISEQVSIYGHNMHFKIHLCMKVFAERPTQLTQAVDRIESQHKALKNANIRDARCENDVADAVCKAEIPACSKDRTKVVWLLSAQDCRDIVGWWVHDFLKYKLTCK